MTDTSRFRGSDRRSSGKNGKEVLVARRDLATGDLEDFDGNPIDPDGHRADELVVFEEVLVMEHEKAEQQDRTILGLYEGGSVERESSWRYSAHN